MNTDPNVDFEADVSVSLNKLCRKSALTETEEKVLVDVLGVCADWGYQLQLFDLRILVKDYLSDKAKENESLGQIFPNNLPGEEWARGFLHRHPQSLSRFMENIKRSRAAVSQTLITDYFKELQKTLEAVPPRNIVNYDETAFVDNLNKTKVSKKL